MTDTTTEPTATSSEDLASYTAPVPPIGCLTLTTAEPASTEQQLAAAIEPEIYEYRERTMLWAETEGVTQEIARLAARAAMTVQPTLANPTEQGLEREAVTERGQSIASSIDALTTQVKRIANTLTPPVAIVRDGVMTPLNDDAVMPATTCSARHHGFPGDHRQCIRAGQHPGDHGDGHGFRWSDTVAVYPVGTRTLAVCNQPGPWGDAHACIRPADHRDDHEAHDGCGWHDGQTEAPASVPNYATSLMGIEVHVPCPYCSGSPMYARHEITGHIASKHPEHVPPVRSDDAACRRMETRTCPPSYNGPCGDRPCARFESEDPTPWLDTAEAPTAEEADATIERVHSVVRLWAPKLLPRSEAYRLLTDLRVALDSTEQATTHQPSYADLRAAYDESWQLIEMQKDFLVTLRRLVLTATSEDEDMRPERCILAGERCGRGHLVELYDALVAADKRYAEAFPATADGPARPGRLPTHPDTKEG
ncbi:hypothetical protein [Streptomyces turgidiscabies]|uniref:hypothetical protein n=1 Tax=Streptomyces turgidiscabies TaxID=85558 RepID=UPI0038F68C1A